ncbi:hypothetical protein ACFLZ7_01735 [Nanoarchaeota archaeon]
MALAVLVPTLTSCTMSTVYVQQNETASVQEVNKVGIELTLDNAEKAKKEIGPIKQ